MDRSDLDKATIEKYYREGLSDAAIGRLYGMTGEGVAYRRNKYGVVLSEKYSVKKTLIDSITSVSREVLEEDYHKLTRDSLSRKYKVSKTVWGPLVKKRGIVSKVKYRVQKYPPLTRDQKEVILGGLLGDGSVSQRLYYYESHSLKQRLYLQKNTIC